MNKSRLILGIGLLVIAVCFSYAQITHGQTACNYACCNSTSCKTGQTCYNANTETAFCGIAAPCTTNAECGNGYSCLSGSCQQTVITPPAATTQSTPPAGTTTGTNPSPAPFVACSSNANCAVGSNNPTSNGINTTVCYYPGTTASYCGTPLAPGDTLPSCAFPANSSNEAGNAAIQVACQALFGSTYQKCVADGKGSDCAYTNQSLAFNCGMPGAGMGGPGYCIPGAIVPGCISQMNESQLAAAVGASCSSIPVLVAPTLPTQGTTGTSGTGGSGTSGGSSSSAGPAGSNAQIASVTSFGASLNSTYATLTNVVQSNGLGTSGENVSTSGCSASAAATTLSSLVSTLQGALNVLSGGGVSQSVIASIQNLIGTIGQIIPQLSSCVQ